MGSCWARSDFWPCLVQFVHLKAFIWTQHFFCFWDLRMSASWLRFGYSHFRFNRNELSLSKLWVSEEHNSDVHVTVAWLQSNGLVCARCDHMWRVYYGITTKKRATTPYHDFIWQCEENFSLFAEQSTERLNTLLSVLLLSWCYPLHQLYTLSSSAE